MKEELSKIPTTPRQPPCQPPTEEEKLKVSELIPQNLLEFVNAKVNESKPRILEYEVAYSEEYLKALLPVMTKLLSQDPNIIELTPPHTTTTYAEDFEEGELLEDSLSIIGDIHGTFESINKALDLKSRQYVFTGDFVDRGSFSIECLVTLLTLKFQDYNKYVLLRGNHETESISSSYSFLAELYCKYAHPVELFRLFVELFKALPICCKIGKILAVHGGISNHSLLQYKCLNRFKEPQNGSALSNILWGDPVEAGGYAANFSRGIGLYYGPEAVQHFCLQNNIEKIVRSHTCVDGIEKIGDVITVFSVPRYMEQNKGAFLEVVESQDRDVLVYEKFDNDEKWTVDTEFFETDIASIEGLSKRQIVAGIICGMIPVDYAFPEQKIEYLVAKNGNHIPLPQLSEARMGRLIVDMEDLCEFREISPLAIVGSFPPESISDLLMVGEQTLNEMGITVTEAFLPTLEEDDLRQIIAKVSKQKKHQKSNK